MIPTIRVVKINNPSYVTMAPLLSRGERNPKKPSIA